MQGALDDRETEKFHWWRATLHVHATMAMAQKRQNWCYIHVESACRLRAENRKESVCGENSSSSIKKCSLPDRSILEIFDLDLHEQSREKILAELRIMER
jgi:hypothetical protein